MALTRECSKNCDLVKLKRKKDVRKLEISVKKQKKSAEEKREFSETATSVKHC